jgi:hypothetical protein
MKLEYQNSCGRGSTSCRAENIDSDVAHKKAELINAMNLGNYGRSLSLANIEESRIRCHMFDT